MKTLIFVFALFVAVFAAPQTLLTPTIITAQSPVISQYHSQDTLGQYSYGYNGGSSAKVESKSIDGITRGSYSYVDAEGRLQTVEYTADSVNGFRAAATNLPKASLNGISDTPEVAQAKAEHFRAFNEASLRAAAEPENPPQITQIAAAQPPQILAVRTSAPGSFSYSFNTPAFGPPQLIARTVPLNQLAILNDNNNDNNNGPQDTPEVALAKIEHLKAVEEQKARIAAAQ
ncbi:adult-specific rigid cuticular protein 15.7-like [Contarinia nasturtii]|uniref:adult-specific rigid cuticular protein 15.7-like n=1 Tax=Contarinia nasturtii TaxID=265458 RepID=UPI0012D4B069|nr:adult-specific rigid cuticular protein 15.7-like [Contarinia nasturtii]